MQQKYEYIAYYIPKNKMFYRVGRFKSMLDFLQKLDRWNSTCTGIWQYYSK